MVLFYTLFYTLNSKDYYRKFLSHKIKLPTPRLFVIFYNCGIDRINFISINFIYVQRIKSKIRYLKIKFLNPTISVEGYT